MRILTTVFLLLGITLNANSADRLSHPVEAWIQANNTANGEMRFLMT